MNGPDGPRSDLVEVRGEGIRVDPVADETVATRDVGVAEARRRFGGIDIPSTLAGTIAALGTAALLASLLAGAGRIGYQRGIEDAAEELPLGGLVAGLITLGLAFLLGGWVAGRMARYDGGRNGVLTAVWFVLLAAIVSALGAWVDAEYNVFPDLHLPQWFSSDATTNEALATGLLAFAVMLLTSWLGGRIGESYHRRADALIAATRPGGVARPTIR